VLQDSVRLMRCAENEKKRKKNCRAPFLASSTETRRVLPTFTGFLESSVLKTKNKTKMARKIARQKATNVRCNELEHGDGDGDGDGDDDQVTSFEGGAGKRRRRIKRPFSAKEKKQNNLGKKRNINK